MHRTIPVAGGRSSGPLRRPSRGDLISASAVVGRASACGGLQSACRGIDLRRPCGAKAPRRLKAAPLPPQVSLPPLPTSAIIAPMHRTIPVVMALVFPLLAQSPDPSKTELQSGIALDLDGKYS